MGAIRCMFWIVFLESGMNLALNPQKGRKPLPEGENENSPGWSAAEPWESVPNPAAPSRRDGRNSPPHVARIVFNAVLLEKGDVLSLEISRAMMLFLARD